jgi:hypothetical protein
MPTHVDGAGLADAVAAVDCLVFHRAVEWNDGMGENEAIHSSDEKMNRRPGPNHQLLSAQAKHQRPRERDKEKEKERDRDADARVEEGLADQDVVGRRQVEPRAARLDRDEEDAWRRRCCMERKMSAFDP